MYAKYSENLEGLFFFPSHTSFSAFTKNFPQRCGKLRTDFWAFDYNNPAIHVNNSIFFLGHYDRVKFLEPEVQGNVAISFPLEKSLKMTVAISRYCVPQ